MAKNSIRKQYARMSAKFRYDLKQLELKINEKNKYYEKHIKRANRSIERFQGKYPAITSPLGKYLTEEDMERAIAEMKEARASGALSKIGKKRSEANLQAYLEKEEVPLTDNQMKKLYDYLDYMREKNLHKLLKIGSDVIVQVASKAVRGHFSKELVIKNIEAWIEEGKNDIRLRRKFPNSSNRDF